MNRRLLVVFVCALVGAGCIGYLVYRALSAGARTAPAAPMADIVVATRNLGSGALIGASDVKITKWYGPAPKGSLTRIDAALNRGVVSPVYEGEPILVNRLAAVGSGAGLAALIPEGMRAFAVKVDEVVGVSGFVTPGMRVDVLMTGIPPGETSVEGPRVKTLMQNIPVLSAGSNLQKDSEGKPQQVPVVNLMVTPEQAESLSLASNQTHIQLVLRNPVDTHLAATPGTAMAQLFGVPPASLQRVEPSPLPKPEGTRIVSPSEPAVRLPILSVPPQTTAQPKMRVVEVLNGTTRTEAQFELKGVRP